MKKIISNFFIALIATAMLIGLMCWGYFKSERTPDLTVSNSTVVYNESSNTSELTVNVTMKNGVELMGIVANDVSYKIVFTDSEGKTIAEEFITLDSALKRDAYERSIRFAEGGDFAPVSGKVSGVSAEITKATYMNLCQYNVEYEGEDFAAKLGTRILIALASMLCFTIGASFMEWSSDVDNLIGKIVLWLIFIAFAVGFALLFDISIRLFVVWLLPNI